MNQHTLAFLIEYWLKANSSTIQKAGFISGDFNTQTVKFVLTMEKGKKFRSWLASNNIRRHDQTHTDTDTMDLYVDGSTTDIKKYEGMLK